VAGKRSGDRGRPMLTGMSRPNLAVNGRLVAAPGLLTLSQRGPAPVAVPRRVSVGEFQHLAMPGRAGDPAGADLNVEAERQAAAQASHPAAQATAKNWTTETAREVVHGLTARRMARLNLAHEREILTELVALRDDWQAALQPHQAIGPTARLPRTPTYSREPGPRGQASTVEPSSVQYRTGRRGNTSECQHTLVPHLAPSDQVAE
jgi:hypothetical protein